MNHEIEANEKLLRDSKRKGLVARSMLDPGLVPLYHFHDEDIFSEMI